MTGVLVANRGEIALRIVRAANERGLRTIAVSTADEADALHMQEADVAVVLAGDGPAAFLDVAALVRVAVDSGADLLHPGYGFLSESAEFARACGTVGITFLGPDPEALELFGDKERARALAERLGVPVLAAAAAADAAELLVSGPVIVKAVAGGGGRGMRIVRDASTLASAIERASSEAERGFGRGDVYVEQYLPRSRHIEVQIVGDGERTVHLGTRDCSLQRRHQKVVESAPALGLSPATERSLLDAALLIAGEVRYRGAGTVEFLVDVDDPARWYFIELNPRLQVEHGVTELVTGVDIVGLQLAIGAGRLLEDEGVSQRTLSVSGVAIEARVTADAGTVVRFLPPPGVRTDSAARAGLVTGSGFDPLIAKVMVVERDWASAVGALDSALTALVLDGVATNRAELIDLLADERVRAGELTTTLIDDLTAAAAAPASTSISGVVASVAVRAGQRVAKGQVLAVVEAMKMEHEVLAAEAGDVEEVLVEVGDRVTAGALIARVTASAVARDGSGSGESIAPPTPRRDREDNDRRHAATLDDARPDAVAARHAKGKRTARENVTDLLDEGTLVEHGALAVAAQRRRRTIEDLEKNTPADGIVTGFGEVDGAPVAVVAHDWTVLAGTQGIQGHRKTERLFELALRRGTPVVIYAEGGGGRPGDIDNDARATGMDLGTFVSLGRLNGRVPTVAIASGRCFAGNAALVGASDLIIATADANLGMGGPAMIEGGGLGVVDSRDIGPADRQFANGVVDVLVSDEAEATEVVKRYLGYFRGRAPSWTAPDQAELGGIVPEKRSTVFDIRRLIRVLADDDSVLELRAGFGRGMVTALIRIEGHPIGLIANDATHLGGAIDSDGADKMARFLGLCNTYGLPVVTLCDTPGFMVGPESEETGAVRHFGRIFVAGPNLSVPLCTVVIRKAWGLGGQAMAGGGFRVPDAIVAWPTGEFGAMGPEGAVRLGYRRELEAIDDPAARDAEFERLVEEYVARGRASNAASVYEIDDVIDPTQTRGWIVTAVIRSTPAQRGGGRLDTW